MTNSLITVFNGSISNQTVQLANARDLHSFLESNQDFSNWIANRISEYGFVQDEDYITLEIKTRGRPRKEYHITLDMGKELAMVERNEKGRQIRKYFIECEREMKRLQKEAENQPLALPEKTYTFDFTEKELNALSWGWFAQYKTNELITYLAEPLQAMGSIFASRAYSQSREYKYCVEESAKIIYRMTKDFHNSKEHEWKHPLSSIRLFVG